MLYVYLNKLITPTYKTNCFGILEQQVCVVLYEQLRLLKLLLWIVTWEGVTRLYNGFEYILGTYISFENA